MDQKNWLVHLARYFNYVRHTFSLPIQFSQRSDMKASEDVLLAVRHGGLSLPGRDYYFDDRFANNREQFKNHLNNVQQILNKVHIDLEPNFVDKVIELETLIAKITMKEDQQRDVKDYYTNSTLTGVYLDIDNHRFLERKLENFSDAEKHVAKYTPEEIKLAELFFETLYQALGLRMVLASNYKAFYPETSDSVPKERLEKICVYDGDYFRRVLRILFDTKWKSHFVAYLQYKIIRNSSSFCSKELNEEFFDFFSRKLSGQKQQKSNEKRSIALVNEWTGHLLGQIYVDHFFSIESKHMVNSLIDTVLDVMKQSILSSDWLSKQTQQKALAKLEKFTKKIGFPDKFKNYDLLILSNSDSLYDMNRKVEDFLYRVDFLDKINTIKDRAEWYMTPQTVNAYYSPSNNEIVFPAAILQAPFFSSALSQIDFMSFEEVKCDQSKIKDLLAAANLGGIGAVIAHEINHAFDDKGREYDGAGNLNDWWAEDDSKAFEAKAKTMEFQVDQFEYVTLDDNGQKTVHHMKHKLTIGENLADLGGLSLGKKALLKYMEGKEKKWVMECVGVLLKSWANIWRQNITQEYATKLLAVDPHAPTSFRGNLVRNLDEFYEIFNIKPGDKMYLAPEKRVVMW
eukprot:TRINITY_DN14484_c0_g1_i1.p1 TRINITY_DN14484_c0_g1~~TRINITY_DN14484_c0_g1_i1.p1  ORF type:complete len:627 (+),score=131.06 TRINITY_DN14484_c0_g1_i1:537-2417(+)